MLEFAMALTAPMQSDSISSSRSSSRVGDGF
jgi:hypothetical protein